MQEPTPTSTEPGPDGTAILIVEDHVLLAHSLALGLGAEGFAVSTAQALDADSILGAAVAASPAVVLLDLDIGGPLGTSLSLIGPLHDLGAHVVMLTGVTDRGRLATCVEAGAIGVIAKSEPFDRLVRLVVEAIELGTLLSPAQRDGLLAELRMQRAADAARVRPFEALSPREAAVLGALMDGRAAETIAEDFVVSIATVRTQIRSVLLKLDVNSQLAAVALAQQAGWSPAADEGD